MAGLDLGVLHPKQSQVFQSEATEILFGGAAGPGKSHLLRVAGIAWAVEIPGLQVYLFRRTYADLWSNHMDGPTSFPELLAPWVQSGQVRIVGDKHNINFANGSQIHLRHVQHETNKTNYQGTEIHVALFDELTQFTPGIYTYLRGRVRMIGMADRIPSHLQGRFPRILAGSNPGGPGHTWVKATFPDFAPAMEIRQAPDDEGGMLRQYVPALYSDNPDLLKDDPGYLQRLEGLGNPELVRALKYGDWDIVAGGMFDDVWRRDRHVRNPLAIPESWYVYRSFDWGASKPFSVGWWAIADGTEAELPDGTRWAPPAGSRIRIAEWYGWNGKPNEGLRLTDDRIGAGIAEREQALGLSVHPGPADNSIFDADPGKDSIAAGINAGYGNPKDRHIFTSGDKAPGSRVRGWQTMRRMLEAAASDRPESPGMWVFNTCTEGFIRTVPVLSRSNKNPEDVDTDAEDHAADEARYAITWSPPRARRVSTSWG